VPRAASKGTTNPPVQVSLVSRESPSRGQFYLPKPEMKIKLEGIGGKYLIIELVFPLTVIVPEIF
jgi:hypothetical protein